jgi:NAD(P)-dependent dehydrogenase (short-subunit alcohol dehydrogenase family)
MSRRVIVTGASSGIGRATALLLAERGYDLGLTFGRNEAGARRVAEAAAALGRRAFVEPMQLDDVSSIEAAIGRLADQLGGLDGLVNNAGMLELCGFLDMDLALWRRVIDRNLTGTFVVAQAAARRIVAAESSTGRIVNVSSIHDTLPLLQGAAYCASKAGLAMLTRCMALELAPHGITVNAVAPGEIASPMSGAAEDEDVHGRKRPDIPAGRPGAPVEVATAIANLLEPAAAYTTGAALLIDGGMALTAAIPNQKTIMAALKG